MKNAAARASEASGFEIRAAGSYRHHHGDFSPARFLLPNGLTIVLMVDRRAPIFAYQTWFRVGSRDERAEEAGMAHLLEHLMFKGTPLHPAGEMDRILEQRGAQTNAATWVDWTCYIEALACRENNLEVVVGFEADRMNNLNLDDKAFHSELEVVKNERRAGVEDSVAGALSERLLELAYTRHPYRLPTLGTMASLNRIDLAAIQSFYRRYYAPNNAVLVLVGDLDPASTLTLLAQHYGPLQTQTIQRPRREKEPRQLEPRLAVIEREVVTPQIAIGYHAPPQDADDYTVLEVLHDALAVGDGARLYRRLVTEDALASEIEGYLSPFAEPGLYELLISVRPGVEPSHVVDQVQKELDLVARGLDNRELNKARHNVEINLLENLRDAETCAESLGHFETNFGDFTLAFAGQERLDRIQPTDLSRVARAVFRRDNRNVVIAQ